MELYLRSHTCTVFHRSFIVPKRPLHDLGAGFMTDEHFARRYLLNDTNTTTTPRPATEAVFFEYTIVSSFTPGITIFANIAFVMFCLKQLLHMAYRTDRRVSGISICEGQVPEQGRRARTGIMILSLLLLLRTRATNW